MSKFERTAGAVLALAIAGTASACSGHHTTTRPTPVPATSAAAVVPSEAPSPAPTPSPAPPATEAVGAASEPPTGSGPQIALRFLRALQAGDDALAESQLSLVARGYFATAPAGRLHEVLRDVADNAELQVAGPCATAERLTAESVVVHCGRVNVVVHVLDDPLLAGVQLSDWHGRYDVFRGPHTHAVTTVAP